MSRCHSNKESFRGQSPPQPPTACRVPSTALPALLLALVFVTTGCASIYSRTRSRLPPDAESGMALRVAEAGVAERSAMQAGRRLAGSIGRRQSALAVETDLDRLEVAAFDLERRARAARDAFDGCGKPSQFTEEVERLDAAARQWAQFVQAARRDGPADKVEELRQLAR